MELTSERVYSKEQINSPFFRVEHATQIPKKSRASINLRTSSLNLVVLKASHLELFSRRSLAQVYAALAYYHANREAVESEIASEDAEYETVAREHYLTERPQ